MAENAKKSRKAKEQVDPAVREAAKRERFLRLAVKRVNKAVNALANVGRMANKAAYSYTAEEGKRIQGALVACVETVCRDFDGVSNGKASFTL